MKNQPRASTTEEFQKLVQEAIYETGDMLAAIEYDEEGMPGAIDFVHALDKELKVLLDDVKSGSHEYKDEDLSFVTVLQGRQSFMVPFHNLLQVINQTHRKGLLTEEE